MVRPLALWLVAVLCTTSDAAKKKGASPSPQQPLPHKTADDGVTVEDDYAPVEQARIVSPWRVKTSEGLKNEVVAAENALSLRAVVDGPVAVYDSPSVSIALRKVSSEVLANEWLELKAPDGAEVTVAPGAKQKHGGPVTITITSYHTGGRIKDLPGRVKYGAQKQVQQQYGNEETKAEADKEHDRVDFFVMKEGQPDGAPARHSVSWAGTVDIRQRDPTKPGKIKGDYELGTGFSVPAHERDFLPGDSLEGVPFQEEKQQLQLEVEALAGLEDPQERHRGYRSLAKRWHPDKNPDDIERATSVFEYLQELKTNLLDAIRDAIKLPPMHRAPQQDVPEPSQKTDEELDAVEVEA